jgi:hypothetical protein
LINPLPPPPPATAPPPPPPRTAPPSGSQFHPILGLYSEPLYSYPQPEQGAGPPLLPKPPPFRGASIYGTLPRHVPPKPVLPYPGRPQGKKPLSPDTARQIYADNTEIMFNAARSLSKCATFRQNSNDTSSLTRSNTNRRRIRWSQEDLLRDSGGLQPPPPSGSTENRGRRRPRGATRTEEEDGVDLETTFEDEDDLSTSDEEEDGRSRDPSSTSSAPSSPGLEVVSRTWVRKSLPLPLTSSASPAGNEESPPALPPRRPPRPSRERGVTLNRDLGLHASRQQQQHHQHSESTDGYYSDYENDPRSLPPSSSLHPVSPAYCSRAGAISRP